MDLLPGYARYRQIVSIKISIGDNLDQCHQISHIDRDAYNSIGHGASIAILYFCMKCSIFSMTSASNNTMNNTMVQPYHIFHMFMIQMMRNRFTLSVKNNSVHFIRGLTNSMVFDLRQTCVNVLASGAMNSLYFPSTIDIAIDIRIR